jgi:hypothetical protein
MPRARVACAGVSLPVLTRHACFGAPSCIPSCTLPQLRLAPESAADVAGVAVTAALVTSQPKRGDHSCHVAAHSRRGTWHYALRLAKGARDRAAEVRALA